MIYGEIQKLDMKWKKSEQWGFNSKSQKLNEIFEDEKQRELNS